MKDKVWFAGFGSIWETKLNGHMFAKIEYETEAIN